MNPSLVFDRRKALGMRLNIPAGTAVRFEVGSEYLFLLFTFSYTSLSWLQLESSSASNLSRQCFVLELKYRETKFHIIKPEKSFFKRCLNGIIFMDSLLLPLHNPLVDIYFYFYIYFSAKA